MTRVKLKICDNSEIRKQIDDLYEQVTQEVAVKWAVAMAKRILKMAKIEENNIPEVVEGFKISENYQGKISVFTIRQAGFKIHKLAKISNDEKEKLAFRVVGQAVSTMHMKEHAMVASDYAIKFINIMYPNDFEKITEERNWQLEKLKEINN